MRHCRTTYDEIRRHEKESFAGIGGVYEINTTPLLEMTEEQRNRVLEDAWARGGNVFGFSFMDVFVSEETNRIVGDFIRKKTAERINDPELAAKLRTVQLKAKQGRKISQPFASSSIISAATEWIVASVWVADRRLTK